MNENVPGPTGHAAPLRKKRWVGVGIGVAVLALGGAIVIGHHLGYDPTSSSPGSALLGETAPPFELLVVSGAGSERGDRLSIEDLRGKVVVLDFWAGWCEPCRRSIPALNRVRERFGDDVALYGVNVEGDRDANYVRAAHARFGAEFPSLHDTNWSVQQTYLVRNLPTLILIDRRGVVRWIDVGVPDESEVIEAVERLQAEPTPN